ncbi:MAG: type II CAAX prenyl endopeptidase Rce1 family protein [Myxococcota bacterium]
MSGREAGPPFPTPTITFALAALAMLLITGVASAFGGGAAPYAVAAALGFGGLGTLAARFVPEPAAVRIGLTPFPARALLPVVALLPIALLNSELDNWIRLALGAPSAEGLGKPQSAAPEEILLIVLLLPVVREFFFRGVLLQGCVSALGRLRGVGLVALLQALLFAEGDPRTAAGALSALAQALALAATLGLLRLASGSLLPCIALAAGLSALGVAATVYPGQLAIPGFNAPGATTPLAYLIPAAASVALGLWSLARQLAREPALPPIPPPAEDDEEVGPLF